MVISPARPSPSIPLPRYPSSHSSFTLAVVLLMIRGIKASILWGILFVTFISWIPTSGNKATYFTDKSTIPGGEAR